MRSGIVALLLVAVALAGCTDAGTDSVQADTTVRAQAESSDEDALLAILESSTIEGNATLNVTLAIDVMTTAEDGQWELTMTWDRDGTVFRLGEGSFDRLPLQRQIDLGEGSYVVHLATNTANATSTADLAILVHPDPELLLDEDPCKDADYEERVTHDGIGEGVYTTPDNSVWRETNGREGLQTPESCPDGPHDTKVQ